MRERREGGRERQKEGGRKGREGKFYLPNVAVWCSRFLALLLVLMRQL